MTLHSWRLQAGDQPCDEGIFMQKDFRMEAYRQEISKLERQVRLQMHHILQRDNDTMNTLGKIGSEWQRVRTGIFLNKLHKPSIWLRTNNEASLP